MLNVITATESVDRDGDEYIITTYAVGGYALIRTESSDRDYDRWYVRAPHELPSIDDMSAFMAETPEFGVNWSACGTKPSADARAYGALLTTAADVADVFNRIVAGS